MSHVKIEEQIGGSVLKLKGQFIGGSETDELKDVLKKISEQEKNKLIISLSKVTYLNSTALGILISAHSSFAKRGGNVILCDISKSIENIFVITKLTLVFQIAETLDEAIKLISE
ncbi:STAS domain-containing protein [Bacteroidota bacterium]